MKRLLFLLLATMSIFDIAGAEPATFNAAIDYSTRTTNYIYLVDHLQYCNKFVHYANSRVVSARDLYTKAFIDYNENGTVKYFAFAHTVGASQVGPSLYQMLFPALHRASNIVTFGTGELETMRTFLILQYANMPMQIDHQTATFNAVPATIRPYGTKYATDYPLISVTTSFSALTAQLIGLSTQSLELLDQAQRAQTLYNTIKTQPPYSGAAGYGKLNLWAEYTVFSVTDTTWNTGALHNLRKRIITKLQTLNFNVTQLN